MPERKIKIKNNFFPYDLRRRRGSKSIKMSIYPDGCFVVTAPKWYPVYIIHRFMEEKADWIFEKLKKIDWELLAGQKNNQRNDYKKLKKSARLLVADKLEFFNQHYNLTYNRISIKNQRSCWGSASQKKNLNFNYKIVQLPEELQNYLIVHELCHLKEMNHSRNFWNLVAETVPNFKEIRKKLRNFNPRTN